MQIFLEARDGKIDGIKSENSLALGIYHKQDDDFAWHDYAHALQSNDQLLFENRQSLSVREQILRHDGTQVEIVSKKCPLFDNKNKIIGLIGFSIELPTSPMIRMLSKREYAAIVLISQGNTDKQIAKKWDISPRTVESYILNAKRKMNVNSRAELIAKLCRHQSP